MAAPFQFGKHILDFIAGKDLNSNEDEMLAKLADEQSIQTPPVEGPSFLTRFLQGDLPQPVEPDPIIDPQEGEDHLQQVLGAGKPDSGMFNLNIPTNTPDINQNLKDAERVRDDINLRNTISKAGKQIGQGLAGSNKAIDTSANKEAMEQSGNSIKDYMTRLSQADKDPKSPQSAAFRDFAKRFNVNIAGDFTADMGKTLLPMIFKSFEAEENRKLKSELMKDQLEAKNEAKEAKAEAQDSKDYMKLGEKLTGALQRGNTAFGRNANIYRSAQALEVLANSYKNQNELSSRQIAELAKGLDSMLSAGGATVSGTKSLIPDSATKDINSMIEYITNRRRGSGMKSFVEDIMDTVGREKANAMEQMQQTQKEILSGYSHLQKRNPNEFKDFLELKGIPSDIITLGQKGAVPSTPAMNVPKSGTVRVRRLKDGAMKTVEQSVADQLLSNPKEFERVQ